MPTILLMLFAVLNLLGNLLQAEPLSKDNVPEPLKPWISWVLQNHPERDCTFYTQQFELKQCSWPIDLRLDLTATGGHFTGRWQVEQDSWLTLPGDSDFWPQQVKLNQAPATVLMNDGHPAIKTKPGNYEITGEFRWDFIPEQLPIAENTGLINLSINGTAITMPTIKEGVLWLKDSERGSKNPEQLQDRLDLQVYRKLIDEVPFQVLTHIEMDVSGSPREIKLSQANLPGFIPMRLDSPLRSRIETDGQVLVQLRPGHWELQLLARSPVAVDHLSLQQSPNWPHEELWVFDARPHLRIIEIADSEAIDASQTNLPEAWRNLPAYRINSEHQLTFKVQRRGNPEPDPNQLDLRRTYWLDFDGRAYTIQDQIDGQINSGWRLNALPGTQLGKISLDGQNQLITRDANNAVGIEIRQGAVHMQADSRYSANIRKFPVTGWQQNFHNVSAELNLPPGWRLFSASGVDNIPESWVARWTLLDLFMVLIAALTIAKLYPTHHKYPFAWGIFALLTLALIWHEVEAPHWIWLNILAVTALLRVLPQNRVFMALSIYRICSGLLLILIIVPFIVQQVRIGLYPQLEIPAPYLDQTTQQYRPAAAPVPAPLAGNAISEQMLNKAEEMEDQMQSQIAPEAPAKLAYDSTSRRNSAQYSAIDPYANVQTGPGLPQWQWHKIHLYWNGSVDSQQQLKLWYISPKINIFLNFLRVLLVSILALRLFTQFTSGFKLRFEAFPWTVGIFLLPLLLALSHPVSAAFPEQKLLDDLEKRMLEAPDCLPNCAEIAELKVKISAKQLELSLSVSAEATVAIPLPAQQLQWLPEQVQLDSNTQPALVKSADGQLWLRIDKGQHQVILEGPAPPLDKFTLAMPLKPHRVSSEQQGWDVTGIHEHGQADQQLQFTRLREQTEIATQVQSAATLPALFRIERTIQFGLDWRVTTRVLRITPADSAAFLAVPLLTGEAVLTPGMRIDKQQLLLNIEAGQSELQWDSLLAKAPSLNLIAPLTPQWTEVWHVDISPIWHLQTEGLAPIHPGQQNQWRPTWYPWPGEQVTLNLTRPEGISGQTLTIESSQLRVTPGKRLSEINLSLQLKSSKGGQHSLTLPEAIELQSVMIDGVLQPIRQQGNKLTLPVKPGAQMWQINWRQMQTLESLLRTPTVDLGLPSVNSHIQILLGQDRWVLLTFGPLIGPAVLFWGILLIIGGLAIGLAKTRLTPLRGWQWFLLLIGLSQIPLELTIVVILWFMLLAWRTTPTCQNLSRGFYNGLQLGLIALTLITCGSLFLAVVNGLLGVPEMQIVGNRSTAFDLNWYQDQSATQLPTASVISIPIMGYRLLMLFWSLWLAISLITWLKWGWQCFSTSELWRPLPPKPSDTPPSASES